jgi:hypothetical protein
MLEFRLDVMQLREVVCELEGYSGVLERENFFTEVDICGICVFLNHALGILHDLDVAKASRNCDSRDGPKAERAIAATCSRILLDSQAIVG